MKTFQFAIAVSILLCMTSVWADDAHHPEKEKNAPTKSIAATKATTEANPSDLSANMKKMQSQMEQLRATTDAGQREKLLTEHMKTMQETMQAMQGNPGMMGCGMMGGHKTSTGSKSGSDGHDMMQMMMDQMMQHQKAMQGSGR